MEAARAAAFVVERLEAVDPSGAPRTVLISGSCSATARGPVRVGARKHGSI